MKLPRRYLGFYLLVMAGWLVYASRTGSFGVAAQNWVMAVTMFFGAFIAGASSEGGSGQKIGDIDPRARPEHCDTISDKARAVAGGVLEAILYLSRTKKPASTRIKLPTTTRSGGRPGRSAKAARASS